MAHIGIRRARAVGCDRLAIVVVHNDCEVRYSGDQDPNGIDGVDRIKTVVL